MKIIDSKSIAKLLESCCLIANSDLHGVSTIATLFKWSSPLAISLFVAAFVVDAFNGKSFGSIPHVCEEIGEVAPSVTNCNTSTSVVDVGFVIDVVASANQCPPTFVCTAEVGSSVGMSMFPSFVPLASAGGAMSALEDSILSDDLVSAITQAKALSSDAFVFSIRNNFKLAEFLADERYSFRHNESLRFCLAVRYSLSGEFHRDHFTTIPPVSQIFT